MATKYDEENNHFQCKLCNGPGEGRKERYKEEMNKRYGPQTWELKEIASKKVCKWGRFEFDLLRVYYIQEIRKFLPTKSLKPEDQETLKKLVGN